jgi:hypothetical protein
MQDKEYKLLIKKWLKKNKPSVVVKKTKMPHITPSPTLGKKIHYEGEHACTN